MVRSPPVVPPASRIPIEPKNYSDARSIKLPSEGVNRYRTYPMTPRALRSSRSASHVLIPRNLAQPLDDLVHYLIGNGEILNNVLLRHTQRSQDQGRQYAGAVLAGAAMEYRCLL